MPSQSTPIPENRRPAQYVSWQTWCRLWRVRIKRKVDGKTTTLYCRHFADLDEALIAAEKAARLFPLPIRGTKRETYWGRDRWYEEFMEERTCMKCGAGPISKERLEWHHRDPATKVFSVGGSIFLSQSRILEEIAKCDLLCVRCHKEAHRTGV